MKAPFANVPARPKTYVLSLGRPVVDEAVVRDAGISATRKMLRSLSEDK
jgi:hypothetical protein